MSSGHAIQCIVFGLIAVVLPHSFFSVRRFGSSYNALAHEFMRMYGALLLGLGTVPLDDGGYCDLWLVECY